MRKLMICPVGKVPFAEINFGDYAVNRDFGHNFRIADFPALSPSAKGRRNRERFAACSVRFRET